jgi:hypothetical protein
MIVIHTHSENLLQHMRQPATFPRKDQHRLLRPLPENIALVLCLFLTTPTPGVVILHKITFYDEWQVLKLL